MKRSKRIHTHIHSWRTDDVIRRTIRMGKACLKQWSSIPSFQADLSERIRRVMHLTAAQSAWSMREEQVTLGEKKLEAAGLGREGLFGESITIGRTQRLASAMAGVVHEIALKR